jgi:hypothetical protein
MKDYAGLSVMNLSSHTLTEDETKVLSRGLTFCPTPGEPDIRQVLKDFEKLARTMRYRTHFTKLEEFKDSLPPTQTNPLMNLDPYDRVAPCDPSVLKYRVQRTDPGPANDDCLETFIKSVKLEVLKSEVKPAKSDNLPRHLKEALKGLQNNENLVIKKADKGSAVVVMNLTDYIHECKQQLENKTNYKPLAADPCPQISSDINLVLNEMFDDKIIHKRAREYLEVPDSKPGRFYVLPKIHKRGVPGRPICSSNGHPTDHISEFVDDYIRKYVSMNESYVRDTQHLIQKNHRP